MFTRRSIQLIAVLLTGVLAFAAVMVVHAQGTPGGLVVGHQQATVGNMVTVPAAMQGLPNGLAGFKAELSTSDPSIASIDGVIFDLSPNLLIKFQELDEAAFVLGVADLSDHWPVGAGFSPLFDVELEAKALGQTTLQVRMLALDDDDGNPMATTTAGVLIVVQ